MRIAVNTRFLLKGKLEGIGWYTYEILKRMVDAHPEDDFFFLFDRPYDQKFVFAANVTGIVVPPPARHPVLWYLWFEVAIPRILKKIKADVFFSPDGYCSLRSKVPTLMTMHDLAYLHYPEQVDSLTERYYRYFVPRFLNRAEKVATVSDYVKNDIIKSLQIPADKIFRAYNGARDEFKPLVEDSKQLIRNQYSDGKEYFLYYGALHPRKNIVNLINAFERFKSINNTSTKLLLIGRMAWQTSEIENRIKNSPFAADIKHINYLDTSLPLLVASAKAVVYISLFEGFGLPVLEAMKCGVPVITSDVTSMPEVAGDAAICVDPQDVNEIVNALEKVEKDKHIATILVQKGLDRSTFFSWDLTAEAIYRSIQLLVKF